MVEPKKLRILIVDDHEVVRMGLMMLLEDIEWADVVGEVGTAAAAVKAVAQHQPNVVLMDIRLPDETGIIACQQISSQWPDTQVIMLTSYADDELISRAFAADACGYILKQVGNQAILDVLTAVRQGKSLLDPAATHQVINRVHRQERVKHAPVFKELTEREMSVLGEIVKYKTNQEIADSLNISEKTVRHHVSQILSKLQITNRVEAALLAIRHHIEYYLPERKENL